MLTFRINCVRRKALIGVGVFISWTGADALAGIAVSGGGQATYGQAIEVPPGVAGMQPKLSFSYIEGGINGPLGVGWSVQGISTISRCTSSRATDGVVRAVVFGPNDKLCLDGQRLIQTNANGQAQPGPVFDVSGKLLALPQVEDAKGVSGTFREFRTEKDSFVRVRAYGTAGANLENGPAYFKAWTKSGQIYEYGTNPGGNANAVVNAQGQTVVAVWAVSRISDTVGNSVDFKYEQRDQAWGSGTSASGPLAGHEWNIKEIQYAGNKVIFDYKDRQGTLPQDAAEAYQLGAKNVSVRRLDAISTYTNSPNPAVLGPSANAVAVKTYRLSYDNGPVTQRSRLLGIQECARNYVVGGSNKCLPKTAFTYSSGAGQVRIQSSNFNLKSNLLTRADGKYGVLIGDFNGDGRSDIIRWSETGAENQLWLSNGDGSFRLASAGPGVGSFNIAQQLFKSNGCYFSMVVDVNGDGLPDIVRIPSSTDNIGAACGLPLQAEYFVNSGGIGSNWFMRQTLMTSTGQAIIFDRKQSNKLWQPDCSGSTSFRSAAAVESAEKTSSDVAAPNVVPGCLYGWGWPAGATYYFLDVNGDGMLDIITAAIPAYRFSFDSMQEPGLYPCSACTKVYIANLNGSFDLKSDSNISNQVVYSSPGRGSDLQSFKKSVDVNGDGLVDLNSVGTPVSLRSWQSNGDGNFTSVGSVSSCDLPIDFNADGRADCLTASSAASANALLLADGTGSYKKIAGFNLVSAGQELSTKMAQPPGSNYGISILDFDGDGRADIFRWHDNSLLNNLYLSNGDGTFREASNFGLTMPLKHSNQKFDFIAGDFTGNGVGELLRVSDVAVTGNEKNLLFVQADVTAPDILQTMTSSAGLVTRLSRMSLPNAGARYASDRGDAINKAIYPNVDLLVPVQVVVTVESDTGIGQPSSTIKVEYAYRGLKASHSGRGMLGFRELRQQSPAADGSAQTVVTQYLQTHPYTGVAAVARTYVSDLSLTGAQLLSQTTNAYCDKTASASPVGVVSPGLSPTPCATNSVIQRPFLHESLEQGWDLIDPQLELPSVRTTNTFNNSGDPLQIVTHTSGTAMSLSQSFTKTTTNTYFADNTSADNWILGRLQKATVLSNANSSQPGAISTAAGNSPSATARQGVGAAAPLSPAVLSAILQLLLDD